MWAEVHHRVKFIEAKFITPVLYLIRGFGI
jgi:hypothetical protein